VAADGRPATFDELAAAADGSTPRALRDHLGQLARWGVVRAVRAARTDGAAGRAIVGWALEPGGRELHRVSALMTRVVSTTLRLPPHVDADKRDEVARLVIATLDDPIVVEVVRTLAVHPYFAGELEAACSGVAPRRSLYRRLNRLIEVGAIERHSTHEVPRRTRYELADAWRPLALLLLLGAWWEWRHADPTENALASDLEALTHAVAPRTSVDRGLDGVEVRWVVEQPGNVREVRLVGASGRLRAERGSAADDAATDAVVRASPDAWCAALITKDRSGLAVQGDAGLAAQVGEAVRLALLAPLSG
jgi:DNA-binding HxlR family transcriptional regulator